MKSTRIKIALLVGGTALLAVLVVLAVYQIGTRVRLRTAALSSLSMFTEETSGAAAAGSGELSDDPMEYYEPASIMEYDYDLLYEPDESYSGDARLRALARWCRENDVSGPAFARLGDWLIYAAVVEIEGVDVSEEDFSIVIEFPSGEVEYTVEEWDEDPGLAMYLDVYPYHVIERYGPVSEQTGVIRQIAFVDVTGEYAQMRSLSLYFLAAAMLVGLVGAVTGWQLGSRIEQSRLAEKSFFENASHELKTPLTAIRGYAEGIGQGVITDTQKAACAMTSQIERMNRLIEDILYRARLESGSVPMKKEPLRLDELVQDCLMPLEGVIRNKGLRVDLDLEEIEISADPDQLEHAVTNLLSNAIKYADSRIGITLRDRCLSVWNDAEELSEEEIRHLFDRFYTGRHGSTGIGLAIVKDVADKHGWKIRAANDSGGVRFSVFL